MTWTITTTTTISASRAVTLAERIPSEPIKFVVLHPGTGAGGTVTIWDDLGRSVASTRIDSLSPRHEAEFFSDRSIFNVSAAIDGNATLSGAGVSVCLVSREAPEPSIADGSTSFAGSMRVEGGVCADEHTSHVNGVDTTPGRFATYSIQVTGDGTTNPLLEFPFPPSLAFVKLNSAGGYGEILGRNCGFNGRATAFRSIADQTNSVLLDSLKRAPGAWLNSYQNSGQLISVMGIYDPDEIGYVSRAFRGVVNAGKVIRALEGRSVGLAMVKRDNVTPPWFLTQAAGINAAGTTTCTAKLEGDGTIVATSDADLLLGESTSIHAFCESAYTQIITYAGGAQAYIQTKFDEIEALLIVPLEANSVEAAIWVSGRPGSLQPLVAAAGISGGCVVIGGCVNIPIAGGYNDSGCTYKMVVIRKVREVIAPRRPIVPQRTINLGPSTYFDCGTDSSLTISGDQTQEFWGTVLLNGRLSSAAGGNDESNSRAILVRSNGAYGAAGTCSFGLWAGYVYNNNTYPGLFVSAASKFNFPASGQSNYDLVLNTCQRVPEARMSHIVITATETGTIKLYIDGRLVRCVASENASFARTAANGHRMLIGAHQGAGAVGMAANQLSLCAARIYARALTAAEVAANYQACRNGDGVPVTDFAEEWLARNYSEGVLAATRRPANNGTLVGTAIAVGA